MNVDERTEGERSGRTLSLTTAGLTLFGVMLGIGTTVGFGVSGTWWVRVLCGLATTALLIAIVKLGTARGRGPLVKLADWILVSPDERDS